MSALGFDLKDITEMMMRSQKIINNFGASAFTILDTLGKGIEQGSEDLLESSKELTSALVGSRLSRSYDDEISVYSNVEDLVKAVCDSLKKYQYEKYNQMKPENVKDIFENVQRWWNARLNIDDNEFKKELVLLLTTRTLTRCAQMEPCSDIMGPVPASGIAYSQPETESALGIEPTKRERSDLLLAK